MVEPHPEETTSPPPEPWGLAGRPQETLADKSPIMQTSPESAGRPVTIWTPEDAASFLAKTIREAQEPLAAALTRPSVPNRTVWLIILAFLLFATGLYYRLHLSERRTDDLALERDGLRTVSNREELERRLLLERMASLDTAIKESNGRRITAEGRLEELGGENTRQAAALGALREKADQLTARTKELEGMAERFAGLQGELAEARGEVAALKKEIREQEALEKRAAQAFEQARSAGEEAARSRKDLGLAREELDAQAMETEALRKQLEASRALLRSLQGTGGAEGPPALKEILPDAAPSRENKAASPK
ncbi:MAG: hypothetical protein V1918_07340 [Planctomycetota bacterium]